MRSGGDRDLHRQLQGSLTKGLNNLRRKYLLLSQFNLMFKMKILTRRSVNLNARLFNFQHITLIEGS